MPGQSFALEIIPGIPARIGPLEGIAGDLWYSWNLPVPALFSVIHPALWSDVGHNPRLFSRHVEEQGLVAAVENGEVSGVPNLTFADQRSSG